MGSLAVAEMHQQYLNNKENTEKIKLVSQQETEEQSAEAVARKQLEESTLSPISPASASSSPSHEFSFTIALHPSSTTPTDKSKGCPPSFAIDLTPADDIFFHGHLLPLHLLSHLPVSPRSSTNSIDSFTLPIKDFAEEPKPGKLDNGDCRSITGIINEDHVYSGRKSNSRSFETKGRSSRLKSFSIFGLIKWRKDCEVVDNDDKEKQKRKVNFDMSHVIKKYLRMVQPLVFFKGKREHIHVRRQVHSFSSSSSRMRNVNKQVLRGRRGEYSAPASMRTSPTNSGPLVATTGLPAAANDSTMEELQAAIQAAIAHCKNSIAAGKT